MTPTGLTGRFLSPRRTGLAVLVAITVAGGVLRFTQLAAQSFWEDEVVTMVLLREHLWTMLRVGLPYSENTPPLYYVIGWVWVRLFGIGPVAIRSLSAIFGTATIPVAYLAARRLSSAGAGLAAAALVAFSPILVWYSQEVRVYSLFVFLSAVSFLFFARTLTHYRGRDLAAWTISSILALSVHYFAAFAIVVEAVWLAWTFRRPRALMVAFAPVAAVGIALVPLLEKQRSTGTAEFISDIRFGARLEQLGEWFTTGDYRATAALSIAGGLLIIGIALASSGRRTAAGPGGPPALIVGVGTVVIPLAPIVAGLDYFFFRNLIIAWVPLAVAAACGFALNRIGFVLAAGVCAVFLIADIAVFEHPSLQRDDWRSVAALVSASRGPTAIAVYPAWDTEPLSYYAPNLTPLPPRARVTSLWFVGVSSPFSAWKRPTAIGLEIPPGFRLVSSRVYQHFLLRRYVAAVSEPIGRARLAALVAGANGEEVPHAGGLEKQH